MLVQAQYCCPCGTTVAVVERVISLLEMPVSNHHVVIELTLESPLVYIASC